LYRHGDGHSFDIYRQQQLPGTEKNDQNNSINLHFIQNESIGKTEKRKKIHLPTKQFFLITVLDYPHRSFLCHVSPLRFSSALLVVVGEMVVVVEGMCGLA
jgi:hypothetical protein